jgi:peroxiredoxin Q/BCP
MINLKMGDKAPDFSGKNQDGNIVCLSDYQGKKLVLYFYPRDETPGCIAEACSLRNSCQVLNDKGYAILGVSPDSEESHTGFIRKYNLPFPLVADTDKVIAQAYGVWAEKKMYGRTYMGILRTTFVIDENGMIENIISKVNTKEHGEQIILAL